MLTASAPNNTPSITITILKEATNVSSDSRLKFEEKNQLSLYSLSFEKYSTVNIVSINCS